MWFTMAQYFITDYTLFVYRIVVWVKLDLFLTSSLDFSVPYALFLTPWMLFALLFKTWISNNTLQWSKSNRELGSQRIRKVGNCRLIWWYLVCTLVRCEDTKQNWTHFLCFFFLSRMNVLVKCGLIELDGFRLLFLFCSVAVNWVLIWQYHYHWFISQTKPTIKTTTHIRFVSTQWNDMAESS